MTYLLLFAAQFIFVFLKAFQQRNVTGNHYIAVLPTSFLMALTEIYVIAIVALKAINNQVTPEMVIAIALGGGLGCIASMWSHNKLFKQEEK